MSGFINLFRNDFRIIFKDYKALLLILVMPIMVIQIFALALFPLLEQNAFVEPFSVALVDQDQSPWTGLLGTQLKNVGVVDKVIFTTEGEARELIRNQGAAAAIILPKNLVESVDYWEPQAGKVLGSSLMYLQSRLVKNIAFVGSTAVSAGLASVNVIYDVETARGYPIEAINKDINDSNQAFIGLILARDTMIAQEKYAKPDVNPVIYYALSLLAVFIMFSSIPCMKLLTEERRLGILTRLNAGPTKSWQTILSKLIVSFLVSSAQFTIILVFMLAAGGRTVRASIGAMIPVFIMTTLAAGAFSILIASIAGSGSAADLIANLSILLMAVIGGSIYPLASLPEAARFFSALTINRWASEGFLNALYAESPSAANQSLYALALITVLFLGTSALILGARRRRIWG